jgi:hypothetical protein
MGTGSYWHWLVLLILVLGVALVVRLASRSAKAMGGHAQGIGGWLVLPIIGFISVILLTGANLILALKEYEGIEFILTDTSGAMNDLYLPIALSLLFGIAVITSAAICLYKIFVSRGELKKIAVVHYLLLASAGLVELRGDSVISSAIPDVARDPSVTKDAIRGVIAAAIWVPYFLVSKRVQNTFGNRSKSMNPTAISGA